MNPFGAYAKRAETIATRPAPLIGITKTRREVLAVYADIAEQLRRQTDLTSLYGYLEKIEPHLLQFRAELDFLWKGDGADFPGLEREIETAFETVEAAQYMNRITNEFRAEPESQRASL